METKGTNTDDVTKIVMFFLGPGESERCYLNSGTQEGSYLEALNFSVL